MTGADMVDRLTAADQPALRHAVLAVQDAEMDLADQVLAAVDRDAVLPQRVRDLADIVTARRRELQEVAR